MSVHLKIILLNTIHLRNMKMILMERDLVIVRKVYAGIMNASVTHLIVEFVLHAKKDHQRKNSGVLHHQEMISTVKEAHTDIDLLTMKKTPILMKDSAHQEISTLLKKTHKIQIEKSFQERGHVVLQTEMNATNKICFVLL
jgi:hypothetical protein